MLYRPCRARHIVELCSQDLPGSVPLERFSARSLWSSRTAQRSMLYFSMVMGHKSGCNLIGDQ